MGCVNSTAEVNIDLVPSLEPQLSVFGDGKYVVAPGKNAVLHVKSKFWSLSDGSFKIRDLADNKKELFACKGSFWSLSDKRTMYEANSDTPVFIIKEKIMQIDNKQSVYTCEGEGGNVKTKDEIFKVGSNLMNTKQYTEGLTALGAPDELSGKMTIVSMKGAIYLGDPKNGGKAIAKVCSPLKWKEFAGEFGGRDYCVEVVPGVDMALIIAMVLSYEEMEQSYE